MDRISIHRKRSTPMMRERKVWKKFALTPMNTAINAHNGWQLEEQNSETAFAGESKIFEQLCDKQFFNF